MAQVLVGPAMNEVVHEFQYNSDARAYAAQCQAEGYRAYVRYDPEVGLGATMHYPSDAYGYVITRVSPSGKTIWVKPLKTVDLSTGHEPAYRKGPWPVWEHTYTPDELRTMVREDSPEYAVRLTKRGWSSHGTPFTVGSANYRRDFSD